MELDGFADAPGFAFPRLPPPLSGSSSSLAALAGWAKASSSSGTPSGTPSAAAPSDASSETEVRDSPCETPRKRGRNGLPPRCPPPRGALSPRTPGRRAPPPPPPSPASLAAPIWLRCTEAVDGAGWDCGNGGAKRPALMPCAPWESPAPRGSPRKRAPARATDEA
jgi:hypothetical protein